MLKTKKKICILGLGYVGLPLALEFGKHFETVGFDLNVERVNQLSNSLDISGEIKTSEFEAAEFLTFTSCSDQINECTVYIVAVPTPIDEHNIPDLKPLLTASEIVGKYLKRGDVVVYESTVFPGATEEVCAPTLENISGLVLNKDFYLGYSPERINPGDKNHNLTNITKLVSGSTNDTLNFLYDLYGKILSIPPFKVDRIKEAEAAKVIENIQRDVNIGLVNEFCIIFDKLNIDTSRVLEAASTKWNFLNFQPGLVGGHCIGVDPYYLTYKCETIGVYPELILAGRKTNDNMSVFAAQKLVKRLIKNGKLTAEQRPWY